jgi:polyphosphate kinase
MAAEPSAGETVGSLSSSPDRFLNRELSWIDFDARVLALASNRSVPLLERFKFVAIFSQNLDEFFQVRVAGLKDQVAAGLGNRTADGRSARTQLREIRERLQQERRRAEELLLTELIPQLAADGVAFASFAELDDADREYLDSFFHDRVFPVLTPLAVDPGHPFPYISDLSLNLAVVVNDPVSGDQRFARVKVPNLLPRFVAMPDGRRFVALEDIISEHLAVLFPGMTLGPHHAFRVTRNADLTLEEDEADDLLEAVELELRRRRFGRAVRLEVDDDVSTEILDLLTRELDLDPEDVYLCSGPLDLGGLMSVHSIDRPDLKDEPWKPVTQARLTGDAPDQPADIFAAIRGGDVLLHHPYESFDPVVEFVQSAANDPRVLAIKQTLYRTSSDSPLVASLIHAAQNGKQVTVIIELKARFDEAANIKWARLMREAGVNVIYGIAGLKTHAKAMLVVRQEGDVIRRYAHLGTGNYHPSTARLYTDLGFLTAREELTSDVASMFNILTGVSKFPGMRELLMAPYDLREGMVSLIDREIDHARAGRPAGIFVKMNALVEEGMIEALYSASQDGISIRLLIRGVCCLRPGVPGVSENIEVRSLVGRFLEHSRIIRFENGGSPEIYLGSADWMPRNLFRRVETGFPIRNPRVQEHIQEIIDWFWRDNVKARIMDENGLYHLRTVEGEPFDAQAEFLAEAQRRRKAKPAGTQ